MSERGPSAHRWLGGRIQRELETVRGSIQVSRLLAAICSACALLVLVAPRSTSGSEEWRSRVSAALQAIHDAGLSTPNTPATTAGNAMAARARRDSQGRVEADVHHDCSASAPLEELAAAGISITRVVKLPPLCVVEGWVAPSALPTVASGNGVIRVTLPSYARHMPRPTQRVATASQALSQIDHNGITIMHADQFVAQAGGGGGGVTVGVQSEGAYSLSTIQGRGELPSVNVLTVAAGGTPSYGDEGTVLLEQVHAVAPNASLAFCEPSTFVVYTACLQQFAKAGAMIMVDDMLFEDQQDPMSSGGTNVQAIEQFLQQNPSVALFTAAGNDQGSYWEGSYTPVAVASPSQLTGQGCSQTDQFVNQFAAGASEILTITTSQPIQVPLTFAWADPTGQNSSNFDFYWQNPQYPNLPYSGCLSSAGSTDSLITTPSLSLAPGPTTVYVATPDASLAGKFLKLWVGGDGLTALSLSTPGGYVTPQSFATGVINIGAVNGSDGVGNNIESYSSQGPITVVFPAPATIPAPALVAPDGINVDASGTNFESYLFPDGNFYGTSASVPNAGGVAALIRGAFPELTPAQLLDALQQGATQLGSSVPDSTFGHGRVDAMGALATFPAPTITSLQDVAIDASSSTTSGAVNFSISGTGTLHFSVTSTNTTLIPARIGQPGVSVSPPTCGSTTLACTLTVTAAPYQGGTAMVTVSAVDGAGRQAPATTHVTVSNPQQAPPPPPRPPPTGGGGALSLWDLFVIAVLAASRLRRQGALRVPYSFKASILGFS
jgi:hypothetical protein